MPYMKAIANGNLFASFVVFVAWMVWLIGFGHLWDEDLFSVYHEKLNCNRNTDSLEVGRCQAGGSS